MGRTKGSRNKDFEDARKDIAARVMRHASLHPTDALSFRELARIADVTPNTLRHYYPSRDAVFVAALAHAREEGAEHLERAAGADAAVPALEASIRAYLEHFASGFAYGVGALIAFGLGAGLGNDVVGPAFLNSVLEPTLAALEHRLDLHAQRGELVSCDVRLAALALLSPLLVALLHQQPLGGARCRPLDLAAVVEEQVTRFLAAYGRTPKSPAPRSRKR